jgi:hypothetical protein
MREAIVFEASRDGYGIDQIADNAMTVGELRRLLEDYNDDSLFILSHDSGYTFGSIDVRYAMCAEEMEDGEWRRVE